MAKVLLFQCPEAAAIRQLLVPMKIKATEVEPDCFHQTLGELAKERFLPRRESASLGIPGESLLVMCDFTEKQMNRLLMELRSRGIRVEFKAILTPTNQSWPVRRMYLEMARERAMYAKQ